MNIERYENMVRNQFDRRNELLNSNNMTNENVVFGLMFGWCDNEKIKNDINDGTI